MLKLSCLGDQQKRQQHSYDFLPFGPGSCPRIRFGLAQLLSSKLCTDCIGQYHSEPEMRCYKCIRNRGG
jgi:hypothetical protein